MQLLQQLQARLDTQAQQRQSAEQARQSAEESLQAYRKAIADLESKRNLNQDQRSRFDAERARTAAQLEVLEQAERSLSGLANGAKFLLQEVRQGHLKGGYQPLSSQLVVPAELETAVAAALGEYLDGIIIAQDVDVEGALTALSGSGKGRAVLLPPSPGSLLSGLDFPQEEGVLGLASQMIESPESLGDLVRLLLGQVLIVRDRQVARRVLDRIPPGARIVTLQGEVFTGTGVVVAGVDSHASTIGRPRRIQELQGSLSTAEHQVREIQAQIKTLEEDIEQPACTGS